MIFETLDRASPFLIVWLALFTGRSLVQIANGISRSRLRLEPDGPPREGMIASELPGLPLMLLHSVGFGLSVAKLEPLPTLLFLWWGPGYLFVAITLLLRARRKAPPLDWRPYAKITSWLCKLSYVAFMACYLSRGLVGLPFVFSAWIIHDQTRLAWLRSNADRTRRVSEDFWIPRVAYAGLLALPFFAEVPLRPLACGLAIVLGTAWVAGLARVVRMGKFRERPDPHTSDNLRDIVYLRSAPCETTAVGS